LISRFILVALVHKLGLKGAEVQVLEPLFSDFIFQPSRTAGSCLLGKRGWQFIDRGGNLVENLIHVDVSGPLLILRGLHQYEVVIVINEANEGLAMFAKTGTSRQTELVQLLAELGFEPEPADGPRTREIRLRHCPFQNLAEQHGEVICSVHLGLMQGALSAMRAPVTVDRLDPFVEPDLCVAHLAPAPTRDRASS